MHAFKEWSLVCAALGHGAQSLILRKGGIHEGRGGFWWKHDRFLLFPTHFHEQTTQFPWTPPSPVPLTPDPAGTHTIQYLAQLEAKYQITDWDLIPRLAALHFWTEDTLRERFDYSDSTGISLAFLRVHRLATPWTFPDEPKYGGCRSWLDLPNPPGTLTLTPVLDDDEHARRQAALETILTPLPPS